MLTPFITSKQVTPEPALPKLNALERPAFIQNENTPEGLSQELVYDLLLASLAFQAGETDAASHALTRAATSTQNPELLARATRMAVHTKRYSQAYTLGKQWVALAEDDPIAYVITALAALLDNQQDAAFELLSAWLESNKSQFATRFKLIGDVFLQRSEGQVSYAFIHKLVENHPKQTSGWIVLAGIAQKNEDLANMRAALEKVMALEPDNQQAAVYLLSALDKDKQAQSKFVASFLKQNPSSSNFRLQYARLLMQDKNNKTALAVLLELLKKEANHAEALTFAALIYQTQENHKQAVKYFKLKLKVAPNDDKNRLYLASELQALKRFDEAKIILSQVKNEDDVFDARRQIVKVIEADEGLDAALKYLDTLEGQSEQLRIELIIDKEQLFRRAQMQDDALETINAGIKIYPDNDQLRYRRALLQIEREQIQAHEADMRILIEKNPDNAHYQNTLGYSLLTLTDKLSEATVLINKAHALLPDDPYILDSKGWLEFKKGDFPQAIEFLQKAFELDQDAEIAAHIGEVYWVQGDHDKAKQTWADGDKIDADNKALIETKARFLN